jgi:hypothetical protein
MFSLAIVTPVYYDGVKPKSLMKQSDMLLAKAVFCTITSKLNMAQRFRRNAPPNLSVPKHATKGGFQSGSHL